MNYVLIYPDELRAESLACYGHPLVRTPNMDQLAAEGVLFEQNYTQHPVCMASRVALMTGWYPHVNGYRAFAHPLTAEDPNFIAGLNAAGFTTCHAGKDDCFTRPDTARIFADVVPFARPPIHKGEGCYTMLQPPVPDGNKDIDTQVMEDTLELIRRRAAEDKPFFLMVSLLMPHPTYTVYEKYYHMYDPDKLPPMRDLSWMQGKPSFYALTRKYRGLDKCDDAMFRKIQAIYLGMITYVDDMVGQIIQSLKANGLYEDTTVILCSDHGDFGGDAGLVEKWPSGVDEMLTRVPLIIRRPGCPAGHRVSSLTQSIDIFPTIFDLESIPIPHDQFGVSLKAQVSGGADDSDRAVYCEGGYDMWEPHCFEGYPRYPGEVMEDNEYRPKQLQQQEQPESVCRVVMQRWKNWKLNIRTNGENELYDLEKDPLEYRNLYGRPDYKAIQDRLTEKMLRWIISTSDVTPRHFAER